MVKLSYRQQPTISTRKGLYLDDTIQSAFFGRYFFRLPGNLWIRQTGLPVPASFRKHFYSPTGRTRLYPLNAFLWALIIQRIFLYTHRLPSSGLPSLFQASQGILRLWKGTRRFQDHPLQTGFPGRSPERFWKVCWSYRTHLPGRWYFQSRHDYLWLFWHRGLGSWK